MGELTLYCYPSGLVKIGRRCPPRTLPIARGTAKQLRRAAGRLLDAKKAHVLFDGAIVIPDIVMAQTRAEALTELLRVKAIVEERLGNRAAARRLRKAVVRPGVCRGT